MTELNPETNVTVKFGDLKELQEVWWGFEGLKRLLEQMVDDDGQMGPYYTLKPLFTRLEDLCFDGGLDANLIEMRMEEKKEGRPKVVE